MMDFMRRNSNSWLTMGVFAVLIFVFAMSFGPWMGSGQNSQAYVATVNGRPISTTHLQIAYRNRLQTAQRYNPDIASDEKKTAALKQQVLEALVDQELLSQWAKQHGLVASDKRLAELIRKQFTREGERFDRQLYKRVVSGVYQTTESQFEDLLQRELMASAMQRLLTSNLPLTDGDLRLSFELRNNKAAVDVVRVQTEFFTPKTPANKQQLQAFVNGHEQEIKQDYDSNIGRYQLPKQVRASHILMKVAADASAADKQKAKKKLEQLLQQLQKEMQGKKPQEQEKLFADLAQKHSQDTSAASGGDLGLLPHSEMVKPFADVAFGLPVGGLSDIVETVFGYHVIRVQEVQEAHTRPLVDVRNTIAQSLWQKQQAQQAAKRHANKLLARVKQGVKPTQLAAKGLLVPKGSNTAKASNAPAVVSTELFTQGIQHIPKLGHVPNVVKTAFALTKKFPVHSEVLQNGDSYYVVRLRERHIPQEKDFAAQKERLRMSLEWILRAEWIDNHLKALREKAHIVYSS
ncbi:MAG: SurA N-terminal domain-containing protein [Myxococcota bacterium]